jgi:hypothetical protein
MFRTRSSSHLTSLSLGVLFSTALLAGCSGEPSMVSQGPMPNSEEEKSLKALKDKFYVDFNCAVYQKIVTFSCENGIVQVMCKDINGMAQVSFFMKDPSRPEGWFSEKDADAAIAAAEAQLLAAQMRKAAFTPAHSPGYQCSPL